MYAYRYGPVRLSEALDRLFDESVIQPQAANGHSRPLPLDVYATEEAYVIVAAVPGLRASDLSLEVLGDTVTLRGEIAEPELPEGGAWLLRERRLGKFQRSLTLPSEVVGTEAEAALENGVLTIRLPKAEAARRKTIKVKAK